MQVGAVLVEGMVFLKGAGPALQQLGGESFPHFPGNFAGNEDILHKVDAVKGLFQGIQIRGLLLLRHLVYVPGELLIGRERGSGLVGQIDVPEQKKVDQYQRADRQYKVSSSPCFFQFIFCQ